MNTTIAANTVATINVRRRRQRRRRHIRVQGSIAVPVCGELLIFGTNQQFATHTQCGSATQLGLADLKMERG